MRTSSFAAVALLMLGVAVLAFVLTPHDRNSASFGTPIQFSTSQR
jgi:hypothetical protein